MSEELLKIRAKKKAVELMFNGVTYNVTKEGIKLPAVIVRFLCSQNSAVVEEVQIRKTPSKPKKTEKTKTKKKTKSRGK